MKSAVQSEIIEFIQHEMTMSRNAGKSELVLVSGDIHAQMGYVNRNPSVCGAMYKCMGAKDVVMSTSPKGKSSTIKIKYYLD